MQDDVAGNRRLEVGEQTMQQGAEYEFTPEQDETIRTVSSRMRWVGAFLIAVGVAAAILGLLSLSQGGIAVVTLIQAVIYILIGVWTTSAARDFGLIVQTAGSDVSNLMRGFAALRKLYTLQFWLIIAGLVILVLGAVFGLFGEPVQTGPDAA
jgi:hypothetical protein